MRQDSLEDAHSGQTNAPGSARATLTDVLGPRNDPPAKRVRTPPATPAMNARLLPILESLPQEVEWHEMAPEARRDAAIKLVERLVIAFVDAGTEPDGRQAIVLAAAVDAIVDNCPIAAYHHARRITSTLVRGPSPRNKTPTQPACAELLSAIARAKQATASRTLES
jgi:hypothetical protein